MKLTLQPSIRTAAGFCLLLLSAVVAAGQGTFQNLGFENTTLTVIEVNPSGPFYTTNATVPGWNWSPQSTFGWGDPSTTVSLNGLALDAPAVTLQGTNGHFPSLKGKYSILLQGGTYAGGMVYNTNGASIYQTGLIPTIAQSMTYLGYGGTKVYFNGQALSSVALSNAPNYTVWGVDVSPYAGQTGEIRFTAPWQNYGFLDDIRFSQNTIPEPSALSLSILGLVLVAASKQTIT